MILIKMRISNLNQDENCVTYVIIKSNVNNVIIGLLRVVQFATTFSDFNPTDVMCTFSSVQCFVNTESFGVLCLRATFGPARFRSV